MLLRYLPVSVALTVLTLVIQPASFDELNSFNWSALNLS